MPQGIPLIGQVGYQQVADGSNVLLRQTRDAAAGTQDVHGRYLEALARGGAYVISTASGGVALAAANASVTAATAQPVVGLLNPVGSGVYANILEAIYGAQATGASAVNEGIPVWQIANIAASTAPVTQAGTQPTSLKTLTQGGSKLMGLVNQALTGNTVAWSMLMPFFGVGGGPRLAAPTASINVNALAKDELGGSLLLPPGWAIGLFVLAAGTTMTVAGAIKYEEIASSLIT